MFQFLAITHNVISGLLGTHSLLNTLDNKGLVITTLTTLDRVDHLYPLPLTLRCLLYLIRKDRTLHIALCSGLLEFTLHKLQSFLL